MPAPVSLRHASDNDPALPGSPVSHKPVVGRHPEERSDEGSLFDSHFLPGTNITVLSAHPKGADPRRIPLTLASALVFSTLCPLF